MKNLTVMDLWAIRQLAQLYVHTLKLEKQVAIIKATWEVLQKKQVVRK